MTHRFPRLATIALVLPLLSACERPLEPPDEATAPLTVLAASTARLQPSFTFSTIDVPGAMATSPAGINAGGDISGAYVDAGGRVHGFILTDGVFTTIDYPNADHTQVNGIGPGGDVVGIWWNDDEEAAATHGFRRTRDGQFFTVHYPGHLHEIPQRILPDGTILGCRHDHDMMASMRGITITRDGATEVDVFASMHNGGTPSGRRVVGLYTNMDAGRTEAYIIDDGVFTPFLVPGSNLTTAWDVNPRGDVVGVYRTGSPGSFVVRGYVLTAAGVTSIAYPGAVATRAFGINARGDVVGTYVASGATHGFLARRN